MGEREGCDCTELCSMGPTCPGGILAGLSGSGCYRMTAEAAPVRTDPLVALFEEQGIHPAIAMTLAAALQPLIDAEKAEAVREALDELIVAHGETFGASCSTSRMWLRERARQLREQP